MADIKRLLIFVHRWLGVALSLVFLLWFLSGIVMMYWTFPEVSARDRLERAVTLDPAQIKLTADEAARALGGESPSQIRLTTFDGRPVYRMTVNGGFGIRDDGTVMVYADDGRVQDAADDAIVDRAAARWAGRPVSEATKARVEEVDQWTLDGGVRALLPLRKYSWPDGQQVYLTDSAEVAQYTTRASRLWAYLGAIPHWFYFTPLRKHGPQWFSTVVWSSLIGTVATLIGIVIAVWMYSPRKRYRRGGVPTSIPYSGWKRWHTIAGLFFGMVTFTWVFSGLLSMGPFPITERLVELTVPSDGPREGGRTGRGVADLLRGELGVELSSYAEKHPRDAVAAVAGFEAKELEYTSFAGEPVYLATNGHGETRIVPVRGEPLVMFEPDGIMRVLREEMGSELAELRVLAEYDAYYLDRHGERPLPVVYARLNDAVKTRYYINPRTARIVGAYSADGWVSRWLYHGLHSLDFPWLYKHRPLWDIVVITLMLGGTALCMTSIILTWRVLTRKLAKLVRAKFTVPNEDLVTGTDVNPT